MVFGAAAATGSKEAYFSALVLAIGMAVQNFPEGAAVALPLRAATGSRVKAFLYGAGSGIVEPIFAIFGYFLTSYVEALQPWLLAFAACSSSSRRTSSPRRNSRSTPTSAPGAS